MQGQGLAWLIGSTHVITVQTGMRADAFVVGRLQIICIRYYEGREEKSSIEH